nr:transposase [Psychrobacter sp. PraFG1]UNK06359.1 transposase [Psychrobacter sp. PraFG1]
MTIQPSNKPKRRTYSPEFKALLVKATDSNRSIASIAREHGINQNLLHNWKRQYQRTQTQTGTLPDAIDSPADQTRTLSPSALNLKSHI